MCVSLPSLTSSLAGYAFGRTRQRIEANLRINQPRRSCVNSSRTFHLKQKGKVTSSKVRIHLTCIMAKISPYRSVLLAHLISSANILSLSAIYQPSVKNQHKSAEKEVKHVQFENK